MSAENLARAREILQRLVGFATMSDLGGEPDGGSDAAPTLLLDGGVSGGGASTPVVVDATHKTITFSNTGAATITVTCAIIGG